MVDVGDKVLSRQGHAAMSMGVGSADRWIEIQKNTFTNWVNEQLASRDLCVKDILLDLCDGVKLVALVECLQQKSLGRIVKEPKNPHQQLGNVSVALKALEDDKIKLINIGAEDIHSANQRLILGLIWMLILRYQVGRSGRQNRRVMLAWLQAVCPECKVKNFTKDWNDGVALHALLEYCRPGLAPDWRKLDRSQRLQNCRNAMMCAKEEFAIPLVCRPEDMSSPDLDELSGMTYLSYFMKHDSPGYNATMRLTQSMLPHHKINNFQTDWNDGTLLCHLCHNLGATIPGYPHLDPHDALENLKKALDAGRSLGVEPVLSAKELADPEVDHIGPMAYCAYFKNFHKPTAVVDKCHLVGDPETIHVGQGKLCKLDILENDVNKGQIKFMVVTPTQSKGLSPHWHGNYAEIQFQPTETGVHHIHASLHGENVNGSPITFKVAADRSKFSMPGLGPCVIGHVNEIRIDAQGTSQSDVCFEAKAPSGRIIDLPVSYENGVYVIRFTPTEIGDWELGMKYEGQHIPGSPMVVRVFDPMRVEVFGLEQANSFVGKSFAFRADCSSAGYGELRVEIQHNRQQIQANVEREVASGIYKIHFTPDGPGRYLVKVYFNGIEVKGSPFSMEIADPSSMRVEGRGLHRAICLQNSFFNIHASGADPHALKVIVTSPTGGQVTSHIHHESNGLYKVEYKPTVAGRYKIDVLVGSIRIGDTYYVDVCDPKYSAVVRSESTIIKETARIEVDCSKAGFADMDVKIAGPTGHPVQPHVERVGDKFHVSYVPQEPGKYQIFITYGGVALDGMPIVHIVQGGEEKIHAEGVGLHHAVEKTESTFVVDTHQARGDMLVQVDESRSSGLYDEVDYESRNTVTKTVTTTEYLQSESSQSNDHDIYSVVNKQRSPYQSNVIDIHKVSITGWATMIDGQNRLPLIVDEEKRIHFDTKNAGPGTLSSKVVDPNGVVIQSRVENNYLVFTPRTEGQHEIDIYYDNHRLPRMPIIGLAVHQSLPVDHSKVILIGQGLKEARVREESQFTIDGSQAGPGKPHVHMTGVKADVEVKMTSLGNDQYKCTYVPLIPGAYLLNIHWSERQVRGSPFKVTVGTMSDAAKVICTGEGLKMGIISKEIKSVIDTRRAGPGELTAHCMGPHKVGYCELFDHRDGTFTLNVKPQELGRHVLQVKYGGEHVPGSPFVLKVSGAPDASKVRVTGPGVESGILANFRSRFICETRGAGAGQLTVRIRGPKGAFRVEMQRESQKDRTILCRYDPTECGDYIIHVKWSGDHVPGSPFHIHIFDTQEELERYLAEHGDVQQSYNSRAWNAEI
ncbi:filamin-A-like isoform X1 [Lineus longissimus]|uniref:filamin-A-like isoform X1 n=1 Tax=Lineus longissimus TaxID=88925 RepID=UPI00315D65C3